ncbi:helix-turn-helix domain-containing protein [Thermosporothrix hazakensis]|nr:helix-turn-helix domain-containing protein [Thermosporothrix hazakensis]GCE49279.1 hypothetical protein KTH_41480 [Thermosporothrix hazakensis]
MSRKGNKMVTEPWLLSVAAVAEKIGVCKQTVYNWIYREGLPTIVIGGRRFVDPDSLRKWIKGREQQLV